MDKFVNKIAIVTGSSSGIGLAISKELIKHGVVVVGIARRIEKLTQLASELNEPEKPKKFHPLRCDITIERDIEKSFQWINSELGPVAILVNNAGIINPSLFKDITGEMITQIFDTNFKAAILWSKLAVENMTNNSIKGHIININSLAGHIILNFKPITNHIYTASKHALKVFSETLRRELVNQNSDIKITNLSPGMVLTEALTTFLPSAESFSPNKVIQAQDIADSCVYVLGTPPNVLVSELTIMPLHQDV
ncbi:farnesol dehydrogenase-like [Planococcus citri]|uniref:farnesol dehydrogenase-like n=1 Tax=Planococcus citri TaxID=170843 RepID=UPI0031F76411